MSSTGLGQLMIAQISRIQSLKQIEIVRETIDDIDDLIAKIRFLNFNEIDRHKHLHIYLHDSSSIPLLHSFMGR